MLNPPMLFGFVFEYTIRKVQENQEQLDGTHHLPYADQNINTLKKSKNLIKHT
jgi:hypothetical protein